MPEQPDISPQAERLLLPLELLLDELPAAGFARDRLGARMRLRIVELLNQLPEHTSAEQLKYKLAALICRTAEEQEKFYETFDAFAERFRSTDTIEPVAPDEKPAEPVAEAERPVLPKTEVPKPPPVDTRKGGHRSDSVKAARSGPITVELHFRDDGYRPWNLPELESVVRPMREKEWAGAEEWDIPNTIRRSIRAGGAPEFVRRRRRKAPQYLFLIEQKSVRDHLAGFYVDLVQELSRRDLDAEYYFYDRIPKQCWKDRRDPSTYTSIERLNAMYQQSRLILIGEPDGLLETTQEPKVNTDQSITRIRLYPSELAFQLREDWPLLALLNTRSTALWGETETAIHQLFPVAPANLAGLGSLMEQWKNRSSFQPYYWKLENPEPIAPTFHNYDGEAETIRKGIKSLKSYLGRQGYTWLCAIAVYPEIYWQLTKILHDEAISQADVPDESLRTQLWHLYLLRMSRLEWLRRGHIPPEYRNELRKDLPDANAAEVRRQLLEVLRLDENKAPEGSYAEKDRAYTVALFDHERYVTLEKPDDKRLAAMQEKLRQEVVAAGVAASDIEDAVGRSLFKSLPDVAVETVKNYWVLWVDDTPKNNLNIQSELMKDYAVQFVNTTSTTKAEEALKSQTFDLIISDVSRFGDKEAGIKMMHRFREQGIELPIVFFTHPNYVSQHRESLLSQGASEVMSGNVQLKTHLVELLEQKSNDVLQQEADELFEQGKKAREEKSFEMAQSYLQQALEIYSRAAYKAGQGNVQHELGKLFIETNRFEQAIEVLKQADTAFLMLDFNAAQAFVLMDLGKAYTALRAFPEAEKTYYEALDLLEGLNGDAEEEIVTVMAEQGSIAREKGLPREAHKYWLDALKRARSADLKAHEVGLLASLGAVTLDIGAITDAITYLEEALKLAQETKEPSGEAFAHEYLARARHEQGNNEQAFAHLNEAARLYKQLENEVGSMRIVDLRREWERQTYQSNNPPYQQSNSAPPPMQSQFRPDTTKLFFLVDQAERDRITYDQLNSHLSTLKRNGLISTFSYFDIAPGEAWEPRLRFELTQADIILPLISVNLLNSDLMYELLSEALKGGRRVVPIMIAKTDIAGTGLEKLRSLPSQGRAITDFSDRDAAFMDIVTEIRRLLTTTTPVEEAEEIKVQTNVSKEQIRNLIAQAKLREALDLLLKASPGDDNVISLQSQLNRLERENNLGLISYQEASVSRNRITAATLELLNSLADEPQHTIPQEIRDLISDGELSKALHLLQELWPDNNDIIRLSEQMARLEKDRGLGVLNDEIYFVERNKIADSLTKRLNALGSESPKGNSATKKNIGKNRPPA